MSRRERARGGGPRGGGRGMRGAGVGAAGGSRGRGGQPAASDGEGRGVEPVASDGEGLAGRGNTGQERPNLGSCSGQQVQGRNGDAGSGSGAPPLQHSVQPNVAGGGGRGRATEAAVGDGDGCCGHLSDADGGGDGGRSSTVNGEAGHGGGQGGRRQRRRRKKNRRGGGHAEPCGRRDAVADAGGGNEGRGDEVQAAPGSGDPGGRWGARTGGVEQKRPHLGGPSVQPLQRDGRHDADSRRGTGCNRGREDEMADGAVDKDDSNASDGGGGDQQQHHGGGSGVPRRNFLSDAVLSWSIADVLNENLFAQKVQPKPSKFDSVEHFVDIQSTVLLEETSYKMELSKVLSLCNERDKMAVRNVQELFKKVSDSLNYMINNASAICLFAEDGDNILELLHLMEQVEDSLHNMDLTDESVMAAFGLNLDDSIVVMESSSVSLNEHRTGCIKLIDALIESLQCPQLKNRDELDRFCIQHSSIIVTPLDLMGKLNKENMDTFDILILCKEAGFNRSIYEGLRRSTSENLMLTQQYVRHPVLNEFITNLFYNKKIKDAPKLISMNEDFKSLGLPILSFMDVPTMESKPIHSAKSHINFAAISGGIWKEVSKYARRKKLTKIVDVNALIEVMNKLEKDTVDNLSDPAHSRKMPGQEFTLDGRPRQTKHTLANVRDQRGQPDTCTRHATLGAMESLMKLHNASMVPPQDSEWKLSEDDLKKKHEESSGKEFRSEDIADRGIQRLESAFDTIKLHGVEGKNKNMTKEFKISAYAEVDIKNTEAMKKLFKEGNVLIGTFKLSMNYFNLKPGEVYIYDKMKPFKHPKSGLTASHAVMMIGLGLTKTLRPNKYFRHLGMQNSEGRLFGINGLGRVAKNSLKDLYRIELEKPAGLEPF
ncbi:hypothetical protein EJB05_51872, partial [Eragrostis curvula]